MISYSHSDIYWPLNIIRLYFSTIIHMGQFLALSFHISMMVCKFLKARKQCRTFLAVIFKYKNWKISKNFPHIIFLRFHKRWRDYPVSFLENLNCSFEQIFKPEVPALGLLYPPLSVPSRPKLNTYLHNARRT